MARILQVCNSSFYLTHFLVPLVRGLLVAGHDVECVCEGPEVDVSEFEGAVRVHSFQFPRSPSPTQFLGAIQRMRRLLRRERYDCVDAHNRNASIVGRVAAWLERVPVNLYTAHGFYFHDNQGAFAREITIALEAALAKVTDYTLSQSQRDIELMTDRGWIDRSKIELIGNGIDTRRFAPRPEERAQIERSLGLRPSRFRVAATGRLVRGKGFTDLLLAFARFRGENPRAELLLIGGNIPNDIEPFQAEFFAQARASGLSDALTVTGMVGCVDSYLATSDVFVLPSYREGMPRALLEAMSMALPVLATDIRGCKEIVRHGDDGLLFTPRDVDQLFALLSKVARSPEAHAAMGRRARVRVCAQFDEKDYVSRQVAAIDRLLASRHSGSQHASPVGPRDRLPSQASGDHPESRYASLVRRSLSFKMVPR